MKALAYRGPGSLQLEDMPMPRAEAGALLVRVATCGICATDLKTYVRGHPKIKPGSGLGHEVAGTIVEAPDSGPWRPGQRVAVAPYVPCEACPACARGRFTLCRHLFEHPLDPGGFSEFVRVPPRIAAGGVVELPDALGFDAACLAEPVACCLHGLKEVGFRPGDSVLVVGDGIMGLMQAALARAQGAARVMLSGMTPARLAIAGAVADVVIDARTDSVSEAVAAATAGEGADVVMVSVADARVAEQALALVRKGGSINLFAGMPQGATLPLDMNRIHYDEVRLTGSFGFAPQDFREALALLADGRLPVDRLITGTVPLADTVPAIERLARFDGVKTVVRCGTGA